MAFESQCTAIWLSEWAKRIRCLLGCYSTGRGCREINGCRGTSLRTSKLKKLRHLVKHACEHVPFYKTLYDGHRVHPSQIRTLDDIRKLPIQSKEFVGEIPFDERIADNFDMNQCTLKTTLGSTEIPLRVLEEPHSVDYLDAYHLRRLSEYGYRPWESSDSGNLRHLHSTSPS